MVLGLFSLMINLNMNFLPFPFNGCCEPSSECVAHADRFILKSPLHPRCAVQFTDASLVQQSRIKDGFMQPPSQIHNVPNCPEQNDIVQYNKYTHRIRHNRCSWASGLWVEPLADRFKCMIVTTAIRLEYKPKDLVLDWGTGCGHMLTWLEKLFGIDGLGIDAQSEAIQWADSYSVGKYCHVNGNRPAGGDKPLSWIGDQTFNHAIS